MKHSKEHALKLSIAEGSAQSVSRSVGESFMTPFALVIGANSFHIGLMSAFSGIVGPLGQWKGNKLMEKYSRKKILMVTKLIVALLFLPVIGLAYLFWKGILLNYLPYILVLLWSGLIFYIWGVGHVPWLSWMGDIVPSKSKGKYFAKRNSIAGLVSLIVFVAAAFVLDIFKTRGLVLLGFSILFGVAIVFRLISRYLVGKIFNPNFRVRKGHYFSFWDFIKKYDNYGKFAFFQAFFFFSIMLSLPFFAVYMLEDLGFNYLTFTAVTMSTLVFYLIFAPLAGKFSDSYGNVKLLYIAAALFPLVPLLWVFLKTPTALIFFPGLISGIANAAYIMGITDFAYDAAPPQKRGLCFAYTSLLVGIGTLVGSLIGGFLIEYANISFIDPMFFVFILSSLLMVMVSLFFLPQIKDERRADEVKGLKVDLHHPFKTIHSDIVWFKNFIHGK